MKIAKGISVLLVIVGSILIFLGIILKDFSIAYGIIINTAGAILNVILIILRNKREKRKKTLIHHKAEPSNSDFSDQKGK